jgi:hypothetical protein
MTQESPDGAALRTEPRLSSPEINALPASVRRYIHDLETRCDPAGDVATIVSLTEQRDGLIASFQVTARERDEALAEIAAYQGRPEGAINAQWRWDADGQTQAYEVAWRLWPLPNGMPDGWVVWAETNGRWGCWHYTGVGDRLDVNVQGVAETPRLAMRAAQAKTREFGLFGAEGGAAEVAEEGREWSSWPLVAGFICAVCKQPVRRVPGGTACDQGHGGAPLEPWKGRSLVTTSAP